MILIGWFNLLIPWNAAVLPSPKIFLTRNVVDLPSPAVFLAREMIVLICLKIFLARKMVAFAHRIIGTTYAYDQARTFRNRATTARPGGSLKKKVRRLW